MQQYAHPLACLALCLPLSAVEVGLQLDSTIDSKALTFVGNYGKIVNTVVHNSPIANHGGRQYVTYYDAGRRVCVTRRDGGSDNWQKIRLNDYRYKSTDSHNATSIGICAKDGTIHLAFDHHGQTLHYRVSVTGLADNPDPEAWSADSFGPVVAQLDDIKPYYRLTYPKFWSTPDGDLQFTHRSGGSGNGDRFIAHYHGDTGHWQGYYQIDSQQGTYQGSDSRCSYPNDIQFGPDGRLHRSWVWREDSKSANHDLQYAYSDDQGQTWHTNDGTLIDGPARVDTPGITVWAIPQKFGLINENSQTIDGQGRLHTVMWHCTEETLATATTHAPKVFGPSEARRYHHYWRDTDGNWQHHELPFPVGTRGKLFSDKADNLIFAYRGTLGDDAGDLCVLTASAASGWQDWRVAYNLAGNFGGEIQGDDTRLITDGILSLLLQEEPRVDNAPTPLHMIDLRIR